ncbi:hypothetical protein P3T76_005642 [Phytophthora citrophthora]|uniref:Myb-like domain-containing protein n=1 Tax=Phytophthora citrophthora TaxID=4793 RepID=A0AAD9GR27_9STRA|nr:hypothetical protein P3T76_005642 [Phytophthora citrophthora]
MGRGKSWQVEDNEVLTRAWLSANEGRLVNRDMGPMWQKIHKLFNEASPASQRSFKALERHWTVLFREIGEFSGIHTRLSAAANHAQSEEEKIQAALTAYKAAAGFAFQHLQCWKLLRSAPNLISKCRIKTEWTQEDAARVDDNEIRTVKKAKIRHEKKSLPPQELPLPRVEPVLLPQEPQLPKVKPMLTPKPPPTPICPKPSEACTTPTPRNSQATHIQVATEDTAPCLSEAEVRQIEVDLVDIATALPALKRLVSTQEFDSVLSSLAQKAKTLQAQPEAAQQRLAANMLDFTSTEVAAVSQEFTIRRSNTQALHVGQAKQRRADSKRGSAN